MTFLTDLRTAWLTARFTGVLLLLCAVLGLRSCEPVSTLPGVRAVLASNELVAPAAFPVFALHAEPIERDTSRLPARPNLQLKMLPQSRWPSAGAYLVFPRPRRPRQGSLDSAAAAARAARP